MQALQSRLQQLENATGSDIWEILKASESELRQDLSSLNTLKEDKEKRSRETLEALKAKKNELKSLKEEIQTLQNEYKLHIQSVEKSLTDSGLDMKQVINVFEKVLEDSLSEKKAAILQTLSSTNITKKTSISELQQPVKTVLSLLNDPNKEKLRNIIQNELQEFHDAAIEVFRLSLWSEFQKQGIPMKKLAETPNYQDFQKELVKIFEFLCDLDMLLNGNHQKSVENVIFVSFGHLSNICVDMIENEKEKDADFEWILTSAHKWAVNLKEVVGKAVESLEIEPKWKEKAGEKFNEKFVEFVGTITRKFVKKNIKDPMVFSKLAALLRRFEESSEFDLSNKDLFEPLYEPEFISKWILLEVEMFTISINQFMSNPACFEPLQAIFIGNSNKHWASEITVFFEQGILRVDKDISSLGNSEVQCTFYECLHALMLDLCSKIHVLANRLYSEASWSNDVYLVMNSIWELRRIIQVGDFKFYF